MVSLFYFLVFAASLFMMFNFLWKNKRIDTVYVQFSILVTLYSLGNWLVSVSGTIEQALWATKLLYIGACFIPFFFCVILARLCELKIPRFIYGSLCLFSSVTLCSVLTVGINDLYYKTAELVFADGYAYVSKEYGPLHSIYPALIIVYAAFIIYLIIRALKKRSSISFRIVITIGCLELGIMITYAISRIFSSTIEWLSIGYLAAVIMITQMFERINIYDMSTNIAAAVERMKEYGFIVFDKNRRYISSNKLIKELFPEIADWKIEKQVDRSDTFLYREIVLWFYKWCGGEHTPKVIQINDLYIEFSVRNITYGRKETFAGYLIEAVDRTAERRYTAKVEEYNAELAQQVNAKTAHINQIKESVIMGIAAMVESRDNSTGGHIRRTSEVVEIFSKKLMEHEKQFGLSNDFLEMVIRAAPMHDLGKIAVDDAILRKKGKFTPEEYDAMKKHSAEGAKIVRSILLGIEEDDFVSIAENVAHYHHEKWNGQGYPCGLSGTSIPVEARIMALADVFDALVSKRYYKEAFEYDKAFSIIEESLGSHFDPALGRLFIECRPLLTDMYDRIKRQENEEEADTENNDAGSIILSQKGKLV